MRLPALAAPSVVRAVSALAMLALAAPAHADTITTTTTTTVTVDPSPSPPLAAQPGAPFESPLAPPGLAPPNDTPPSELPGPLGTPDFRVSVATGGALGFDTKDKCAELECVGAHLQIGTRVGPKLLAVFSSSIMTVPDDDKGLHNGVHHVETFGLQYWWTPRLWAEAGLGAGSKRSWSVDNTHDIMDLSSADTWAPAGTLAVGYAPWRTGRYGFDVQARVASTDDIHHTSFAQLLAGFDWY